MTGSEDDSMLLAQAIPIPDDDSDSDDENLMSFSAPFEIAKAAAASRHTTPSKIRTVPARGVASPPHSTSQARSASPKSALSRGPVSPGGQSEQAGDQSLVVEDALRFTAEQAESAAERLLEELVDEDGSSHQMLPAALIPGRGSKNGALPSTPAKASAKLAAVKTAAPSTPINNRGSSILRQAAAFNNSPAYNGRSSSLIDMLHEKQQESAWWLKRKKGTCN